MILQYVSNTGIQYFVLVLQHTLVPAQCGTTNAVSTNMPLIGYLEQIFLILREKLGEMMTLFHTVAFCGHL